MNMAMTAHLAPSVFHTYGMRSEFQPLKQEEHRKPRRKAPGNRHRLGGAELKCMNEIEKKAGSREKPLPFFGLGVEAPSQRKAMIRGLN